MDPCIYAPPFSYLGIAALNIDDSSRLPTSNEGFMWACAVRLLQNGLVSPLLQVKEQLSLRYMTETKDLESKK